MRNKFLEVGNAVKINNKNNCFSGMIGIVILTRDDPKDAVLVKFNNLAHTEFFYPNDLEFVPKTLYDLNTLAVGDLLVNINDNERIEILLIINNFILLGHSCGIDTPEWYEIHDAIDSGLRLDEHPDEV